MAHGSHRKSQEELVLEVRRLRDRLSELERIDTERRWAEEALRESEERLRLAVDAARKGYWDWDIVTGRMRLGGHHHDLCGLAGYGFGGTYRAYLNLIHPDDRDGFRQSVEAALGNGGRLDIEFRCLWPDGSVHWLASRGKIYRGANDQPVRMTGEIEDITEQKQAQESLERRVRERTAELAQANAELRAEIAERQKAEEALRESEERFQAFMNNSPTIAFIKDPEGRYVYCNRPFQQWREKNGAELAGLTAFDLFPADVAEQLCANNAAVLAANEPMQLIEAVPDADGTRRHWLAVKFPIQHASGARYLGAVAFDITPRCQAEEQIRASLQEKEALLKEVHHRVKNNLQIVSSLLNLQANQIQDERVRGVFRESQNRIRSMALIHEALYRSRDLARIDVSKYLENLCGHLVRSYGIATERIVVRLAVADVALDLDRAIPCGLLINELVSNAFQHAFPDGRDGKVLVELRPAANGGLILTVADDGVGLPGDRDGSQARSLGLKLVTTLVEQLGGTLHCDGSRGTTFRIMFRGM